MKAAVVGAAFAVLAVAGCQSHAAAPSAAQSADEAKAQKIVQACVVKSNFLSKAGRKGFEACLANGHNQAEVQACAQRGFAKDGVLTKAARARFEQDITACVISNNKKVAK